MIKTYKKGDLTTGFIGVRVAVSIGGKVKQKWFNINDYDTDVALQLAAILEAKWIKLQKEYKQNVLISKRSNTGLACLSFTYDVTKQLGKTYKYPIIKYQSQTGTTPAIKTWYLNESLVITDEVWEEICLFVKNTRTLKYKNYEKLRTLKPCGNKFFNKS